ncbi:hypothetical protein UP10_26985 [Bradyrhizobium sp. LTSPM299]|uniref:hypothetical protein n=1 Tax=Bradyrhizobium sp. LTSPM299 TaxID=1619233 RepID=UPI0005C89D8F|nr:hypothetical protein [Bradyrhizobium sp. LTSPM299]KJC57840.1 hypothetical protein UP10_26985 [Bradyrhizobium sp. LTSPM299]
MLSYLKKFAMDILPSVAATIIGAYIVNHYIVARPEAPAAAAISAAADPKADPKATVKPAEKPTVISSLPEAGVKAKGMSERTLIERSASEKATVTEKPAEKSADLKGADAPADTASIPADTRHHPVAPKAVAKLTPATVPAEAAVAPEETRDANDLARAAIERLRKERPQEASRPQEAPRATDVARLPETPRAVAVPTIRPLPPPIMVSNPSSETVDQSAQPRPPYATEVQDPNRMTPPADIPVPVVVVPPLDLRAEASEPPPAKQHTSVADDMLSSVKSVFHAVLPK